jgi:hypothetical protein
MVLFKTLRQGITWDNIDLGHITLDFHEHCDGKAYVEFGAGKYLKYIGRNVNLNFD